MMGIKSFLKPRLPGRTGANAFRNRQSDPPIRVMIGTCPGSRADTEALARAMVDRYFDIPGNSYFYIQRQSGVGYHYEIQEGGGGQAYLPQVVQSLIEEHADGAFAHAAADRRDDESNSGAPDDPDRAGRPRGVRP